MNFGHLRESNDEWSEVPSPVEKYNDRHEKSQFRSLLTKLVMTPPSGKSLNDRNTNQSMKPIGKA